MTARPVFPECRRGPANVAVALVLVMGAVLLAAGCVSPGSGNKTQSLPAEKFVILEHNTNFNASTISGKCVQGNLDYSHDFSFDEKNGVLTRYYQTEQINDSLIVFYGHRCSTGEGDCGNSGGFVYSVPRQFNTNVTIESIREDGTVVLRYKNIPIILKPKERRENITREIRITEPIHLGVMQPGQSGEDILAGCTEEIIITDTLYNAGVFEKNAIITRK